MEFSLGEICKVIKAQLDSPEALATRVAGWSIDSRTTAAGDMFFALPGERVDGHDYVAAVLAKGAAAAIVSRPVSAAGNVLRVADSLRALQDLAAYTRQKWAMTVIGVTGSAGKTSTKDIIAALLSVRYRTGKTVGNFNNHIGLPLSILRLPADSEVAVLEMGMNHAGEIRDLCLIAKPNIGVVTNVGYAHVEFFDGIEGVAAAKRELIEGLSPTGIAILNADDPLVAEFSKVHPGQTIFYGIDTEADVKAEDLAMHSAGSHFTVHGITFSTQLTGRHNVSNILAGIAVANSFGIATAELPHAVAALTPGKMRGERHIWNGVTVLNDAYNANPEAVRHMLDVLRNEDSARRIAVLGEMLELGAASERLHREIGEYVATCGIDILIGIRGTAAAMVGEAVRCNTCALFFQTPEEAGDYLRTFVKPGDSILFKGSRGTHVEHALAAMEAQS